MVFLMLNGYWMDIPPQKLYNLAVWVASSDSDLRDAVIAGLVDFVQKYAKKIKT
jgi:prophage maintenance system killer protein